MGDVSWRGGSHEVARPMATTWLKMEDAYNLCNVIEMFFRRKVTKIKRRRPFGPFKLQTTLAQLCNDTSAYLCRHPNTSTIKGRNWSIECWNKSARVGSTMTMSIKVQMLFLLNTMSIRQREELNVFERNTCSCFRPMWKPTSCAMAIKVSQSASGVHVHSLPWTQCKRWIPIRSMGCVYTNWKIHVIKGWGSSIVFKALWKRLDKLIKSLRRLVEP
jgi:hypothetical protein